MMDWKVYFKSSFFFNFWRCVNTAVWTRIEMCRDFFVKASLTFFWPNNSPKKESNGWEGITVVPGGHLSVILVVIIGFWQWGVRKGQNMAQNGLRLNICQGCRRFLTISDPRWDQPISDISIFFASGRQTLMHKTHFMQNIWGKWPKRSIFKIRTAVATKATSLL